MLAVKTSLIKPVLLLFFLVISTAWVNAQELTIITCECPPLSYSYNGVFTGPAVDIVKRIQEKIESSEDILIYPWARAYRTLQQEPNVMLFSTARTQLRESLFKWVGPIAEKKYSFYGRASSNFKILSLNDAKHYTVGVIRDSNNHQFLNAKGFDNLSLATTEEQNINMLRFGRLDLWYTGAAPQEALNEAVNSKFDLISEVYTVQSKKLYFAFSVHTSGAVIKQWQTALNELYENGTILNIFKKYNRQYLYSTEH